MHRTTCPHKSEQSACAPNSGLAPLLPPGPWTLAHPQPGTASSPKCFSSQDKILNGPQLFTSPVLLFNPTSLFPIKAKFFLPKSQGACRPNGHNSVAIPSFPPPKHRPFPPRNNPLNRSLSLLSLNLVCTGQFRAFTLQGLPSRVHIGPQVAKTGLMMGATGGLNPGPCFQGLLPQCSGMEPRCLQRQTLLRISFVFLFCFLVLGTEGP